MNIPWIEILVIYCIGFTIMFVFFTGLKYKNHWVVRESGSGGIAVFSFFWPIVFPWFLFTAAREIYKIRKLHKREFGNDLPKNKD